MNDRKVTPCQKKLVGRKLAADFLRVWETVTYQTDEGFIKYLYALLFRVYELHLEEKYLSLMQAQEHIPLLHSNTRKRYLEFAVVAGYLLKIQSPSDGRKFFLKPTDKLLKFVEKEIEREWRVLCEIVEACD